MRRSTYYLIHDTKTSERPMKPDLFSSSLWVPLIVAGIVILGFVALMLIAEPSARLPSLGG